ncbi:TadE/TadG family type IV pilus assembly protein [Sphingopyxis solisilvae]|uniref:TadE/TadG family type IV pilus assembly protein n=1 Tax=Sphingopyxis solisilvae TaxID=1886788 RepID=UPI0018929A3B|nr:TadE/TadG family type IV pilus assembly protein [Sphingopyxis solisilvae]
MAAEFAMVIPLLLTFSLGIIEFGRAMWMRNTMQSVVEAAARCYALDRTELIVRPCSTVENVRSFAATSANNAGVKSLTSANFAVSSPTCGRQVTATYGFQSLVPVIPLNVTLTAKACRPATPVT